ncbi:circularly permuted type 2 ATP-grasp protein [Thalassobaculum salexigens]|uniref:circularly permuted type 2 ATP-grasp protein n=1 Tax=Thalassobaculum salexigens TaxID=455360 RepID=UPI0003F987E7|nr:circularly permuted type 2 ATP-grasp protein [Thalassobaculum salexigens]
MSKPLQAADRSDWGTLLDAYRTLPGVADELFDSAGRVRPVWQPFLRDLAALDADALDHALARGDQYLRDAGVFFRQYGPTDSTERDWPLSHLPMLIEAGEWQNIATALMQRADVLEAAMADFYGPNRLVADGVVPARLLASNPEWLRPMVGIEPRHGHYLHFIAFDIGRGPDGKWWVLGDRTQAPSGAGFALETRMATSRSFSSLMSSTNVMRLAGFFRRFRDTLLGMRNGDGSRVAILTPGPLNDTYFEHSYIARYLGLMLVQGADLAVKDNRLMVRTVGGLQPISVLWRRLDAEWTDPLELNERSRLGTPGMIGALRSGSFTMVNALGSGALEARALMAFMPRMSEHLTGQPLAMPNIATWWCGGAGECDYVKANLERMTIDSAMSTRLPFDHGPNVVIAGKKPDGTPVDPAWIDAQGPLLAGQEIVSLSTAPALVDGKLEARPMSLRVFVARSGSGWVVMPGGFARIGHSAESADISMQRGGAVSDVWVVSDDAGPADTLLETGGGTAKRTLDATLPSTAADNLFWLGRYVERTDFKLRLLRAYHIRLAETGDGDYPLAVMLSEYLEFLGADVAATIPDNVLDDMRAALRSSGQIRDRFSTDAWNALVDLSRTTEMFATRIQPGDDAARAFSVLLRKIAGFAGLVHENMYRFTGWRFLGIGRALERAGLMMNFLRVFTDADAPEGALDLAIEVGDSIMTHRRRYAAGTSRDTVIDLLLLDDMNPRSVLNQLVSIDDHASYLPVTVEEVRMTPFQRKVLEIKTALTTAAPGEVSPDKLEQLSGDTATLSGLLADTYLR